ncbi:energy-dependent translational throttle protein EttA [Limnoglobus roseus]|uniref:Energy-dependent translational throttle protein EttA n=1 Tax=Limnoglobus roseus TaxID=2598579 RepID=A0A5C1A8X3_9BACT|nr:energy-dependent translational throttle protein EttA [Limnoglobus roseus]QEL14242.1 energy-dependent translational throttle protein EttA [Limnoglobus roseus]
MGERYIFTIDKLTKHYGKREVLKDIQLAFYPGAKIGVIGSNGSGKSTLLRIMALQDKDFMGEARPENGLTIGYVPQEPMLTPGKTVLENVEEAVAPIRDLIRQYEAVSEKFADPDADFDKLSNQMERLQTQIDAADAYNIDRKVEMAMDAMQLPPGDAGVEHLSGGERRRVFLCKMLLQNFDLLLLDEPTNHLDAESIEWLEHFLKDYKGAVVAITHDRYFLDNVAQYILELDRGRGYPFVGNYTGWMEKKKKRLELEEKEVSARQKQLERELEWSRMAPRARMGKNKARLAAIDRLQAQEIEDRDEDLVIQIPPGPMLGDLVVRAEGVKKSFGDKLLFDDLTFNLPKGGIVGIIGPNGAGKTTLFKMIVGQETPDGGKLTVGPTVKPAHVDQNRDALTPTNTVFEEITGGTDYIMLGKQKVASRGYCARFNFKGPDQQKIVGNCSGGERNRIHLAKLLRSGGNVLLLDEPTNDLDVDTLRALEESLLNFGGCAVVISHDRWFLDRIATHILAFEGDSKVVWCEGNFQVYEEQRHARLGSEADTPKRMKYRKLS